jgi:Fe-only nitrogenase accessory protein AnfO
MGFPLLFLCYTTTNFYPDSVLIQVKKRGEKMQLDVNTMAVFFDDNNQIASFNEMTYFVSYTNHEGQWQKTDPVSFRPVLSGGMAVIRNHLNQLIGALGDCKIIIAKALTGLPYQVFDQAGLIICESEAFDLELLDAIQSDLLTQEADAKTDAQLLATTPTETDRAGNYFIDLTQLQQKHPELSTKMALLPFLRETPFYALEMVCDHIPPWFDHQFPGLRLCYTLSHEDSDGKHVVITHAVCKE